MRNVLKFCIAILITLICMSFASPSFAIKEMEEAINDLSEKILEGSDIDTSRKRAEGVINEGKMLIADLKKQVDELESEKAELQRVQTTLTGSLIGAIITAIVAIAGVVLKTLGSRGDKDLKRLEALQKLSELEGKGISVPIDIQKRYKSSVSTQTNSNE